MKKQVRVSKEELSRALKDILLQPLKYPSFITVLAEVECDNCTNLKHGSIVDSTEDGKCAKCGREFPGKQPPREEETIKNGYIGEFEGYRTYKPGEALVKPTPSRRIEPLKVHQFYELINLKTTDMYKLELIEVLIGKINEIINHLYEKED